MLKVKTALYSRGDKVQYGSGNHQSERRSGQIVEVLRKEGAVVYRVRDEAHAVIYERAEDELQLVSKYQSPFKRKKRG